jgi:hypothetical protein
VVLYQAFNYIFTIWGWYGEMGEQQRCSMLIMEPCTGTYASSRGALCKKGALNISGRFQRCYMLKKKKK